MGNKICFVIMGFGKKVDYATGRELDLNKTYKNIIHPIVSQKGFKCVRADEIRESGIIDKSMYALLYYADLVIADISTANPNAIYELGIRHAVRPYSTIVLKEKEGKIPFDLDHTRIFTYSHLGDDIGVDEARRCKNDLGNLIESITKNPQIDSPMYEYIDIKPPTIAKEHLDNILQELADKTENISAITESAQNIMKKVEKGQEHLFNDAFIYWNKAYNIVKEEFFIQQMAFCKYKSNTRELVNLMDALTIIKELDLNKTTNPETLGIAGAIYKNMYLLTKDISLLSEAIELYEKGYKLNMSYYNGENLATCLDLMIEQVEDSEEKIYFKINSKKTRKNIVEDLENIIKFEDIESRNDKKWIYATLANCYFHLEDEKKFREYQKLFLNSQPKPWEIETFNKNLNLKEEE